MHYKMQTQHILLSILVAAIWGANFLFIKIGVDSVPPLFLCALRFFFASIPAIFFIKRPSTSFKMIALYGLVTFGLQFSFIFSSFAVGMTAGMAALLMQTQIFFNILFASLFLQERLTRSQIMGALVAFLGIGLVAKHLDGSITLLGFILVISGAATWGLGNLIIKKIRNVDIMQLIVWGSLFACFPLIFTSLLIEGPEKILHSLQYFSWPAVISLIYIVYLSTWIGYGVWNWLIGHYPVTTIAPFTLLVPIFGMFASVIFLGENLEAWKLIAAMLVLSGLAINLIGARFAHKKFKLAVENAPNTLHQKNTVLTKQEEYENV